ncbi:MAG: hypothetical protein JWQ43_16 [Glaciihabitans sp.]|nr:hypothetical protein [Glaciihabitans sp.]
MGAPSERQASLERDLRGAAGRGELVAHFQPQVDLSSRDVVGAEALCRWNHPTLGLIPPERFIAMAERSDVIHEVGEFMLAAGCDFLTETTRNGYTLDVSVNVSPSQLASPLVLEYLLEQIESRGLDPSRLTLEITESLEIMDIELVSDLLHVVRDLGVGISIDDFGTGHTSEEQVNALPVTEIKIDRSIVQDTSADAKRQFRHAMSLAKKHRLRSVAEGVELSEQMSYTQNLGCDRAQGYLFGEGVPLAEFINNLTARPPADRSR